MKTFNDFLIKENSKQDDIDAATHVRFVDASDDIIKKINGIYAKEDDACRNTPIITHINKNSDETQEPISGMFLLNNFEDKTGGSLLCLKDGKLSRTDGPAFVNYNSMSGPIYYMLDDCKILNDISEDNKQIGHFGLKWLLQQVLKKNNDAIALFNFLFKKYKDFILKQIIEHMIFYVNALEGNFKLTKIITLKALQQSGELSQRTNRALGILLTPEIEYDILSKDPSLATKINILDPKLLDNIKLVDGKYGLDLAKEIEARIS